MNAHIWNSWTFFIFHWPKTVFNKISSIMCIMMNKIDKFFVLCWHFLFLAIRARFIPGFFSSWAKRNSTPKFRRLNHLSINRLRNFSKFFYSKSCTFSFFHYLSIHTLDFINHCGIRMHKQAHLWTTTTIQCCSKHSISGFPFHLIYYYFVQTFTNESIIFLLCSVSYLKNESISLFSSKSIFFSF